MIIDITDDLDYMYITSDWPNEIATLRNELTVEIPNAYILKKTTSVKHTERKFISDFDTVPINLWVHVLQLCKKNNINVQLSPAMLGYVQQFQFSKELFMKYIDATFSGALTDKGQKFYPYEHQITGAYMLLKYKHACAEITTSAGKTLLGMMLFKYLFDVMKVKKILYIVPSVDLGTQSIDKFQEYENCLRNHKHNWKAAVMYSGMKKKDKENLKDANFVFSTYQLLARKNDPDFFNEFNAVFVDEAHHAANASIKKILSQCTNLMYSFGITGTFPKMDTKGYENLMIQSYLGPYVWTYTSDELIRAEKATPVYIVFQFLNWATKDEKREMWLMRHNKNIADPQAGTRVLTAEEKLINNSYERRKYIGDLALKAKVNTLVLFGDIKGQSGKRLFEYIRDNGDKNVFYMDGNTKSENRDWMFEQMENDMSQKTVCCGSIGVAGEGRDIKNVGLIIIIASSRSDRLVRQMIGRGLRLSPTKDKTVIIDIVDDLRYSEDGKHRDNYMIKHYRDRRSIYEEQKFPCYKQNINFFVDGSSSSLTSNNLRD